MEGEIDDEKDNRNFFSYGTLGVDWRISSFR